MNNRITKKAIARRAPRKTRTIVEDKPGGARRKRDELASVYGYILNGGKRSKVKPSEPKTIGEYDLRLQGPSQNKYRVERIARALHSYMQFRAEREGVEYKLTPEFFGAGYVQGYRTFFGVTVNDSSMVSDDQQPELFNEWNAS
jgi:hypothetical protein